MLSLCSEIGNLTAWTCQWADGVLQSTNVLGPLGDDMRRILNWMQERGPVTAADLGALDRTIGATAWSNRLASLHNDRLLRRWKDGRKQVYALPWKGETMGEDFMRRRAGGFRRRVDEAFSRAGGLVGPDLFSGCIPDHSVVLSGELVGQASGLAVGSRVWSPGPEQTGEVAFYLGARRVIELHDESAKLMLSSNDEKGVRAPPASAAWTAIWGPSNWSSKEETR